MECTKERLKELETELESYLEGIEEAVTSGDYGKAFKLLQKAKVRAHLIKTQKLWNRGNRYFAIIAAVREAQAAFKKRNVKELETALEKAQNLLVKG